MFSKRVTYQILSIVCIIAAAHRISAQINDTFDIVKLVHIDTTITITAQRGLNVKDMIDLCRSDETLYRAFNRLRYYSLDQYVKFDMTDKRSDQLVSYESTSHQLVRDDCRFITLAHKKSHKRFFKKKKPRYYTYSLFNRLFPIQGKYCGQQHPDSLSFQTKHQLKGKEKYVQELKKLIFSPGEHTNIPMLGDKTEIFSEEMSRYYNFSIIPYSDSLGSYYIFSIRVKDDYPSADDKTVIKHFDTYFHTESLDIVNREYHLKANTIAYTFDVTMRINLATMTSTQGDTARYIPTKIVYEGYWNIPFKAKEKGRFTIDFTNIKPRP